MRVHLLSLPNVQTTAAYDLDGFNTVTIRFAKLLKGLGHYVCLYASEENEAPCDELVTCITKAEQKQWGGPAPYQHANIAPQNPLWRLASPRMIAAIQQRKQPQDIICTIGGGSQADVTQAHPDLFAVEYCIGYEGCYAPYRVFQSQAWRHMCYGAQGMKLGGRFFDEVIPAFYETEKFPFTTTPDNYVLYVGRIIPYKGIQIACQAAQLAGVPLKVIGHGDLAQIPKLVTYGEYLGALNEASRNQVMAHAKALICPTIYVEPMGMIAVEAQLAGTPVISTDHGGFTESVEHGYTGYRCNLLGEFVSAIGKVESLDREKIRDRAHALYSMETGARLYDNYFRRLLTLWDKGWNTEDFEVR